VKYKRLPGHKSAFFRKCTLYRGEDHFLSVESNIYTEEYFRFYFADIQAFIFRRTDRGKIWSIVLGFLALILTTCTINDVAPPAGHAFVAYGIVAVITIVFLVYNVWLGPTCVTYVQTAVTMHELQALERKRRVEKFLTAVHPLITKVQGQVDPGRLREIRVEAVWSPEVSPSQPVPDTQETLSDSMPVAAKAGPAHGVMFAMMLLSAGADALWVFSPSLTVLVTSIVLSLIMFVFIILALVIQSQRVPSIDIRRYTWAAMIGFMASALITYILTIVFMMGSIDMIPDNPWKYYEVIAQNGVTDMPLMAGFILLSAAFYFVIGILGIFAMLREGRAGARPPATRVFSGRRVSRRP
jgi:hypothetical protein